ncbi:hypothetical protein BDW02DRAFT_531334 [Decorospora gaudefroyi]|uniref:Elongator complex protein 5 n=1 Tax=Decorospora gaudefroyi TaxID=184978 RepID=A0A6A5K204_9PLEO|nr:hypothetical protein BDW02DRAFT_531334 [Decorospora gaudefroyi]
MSFEFGRHIDWSNVDWDAVLRNDGITRSLRSVNGELPAWLVEYRVKKLANLAKERVVVEAKPKIRARDSASWIKSNNRNFTGTRKREIVPRSPFSNMDKPLSPAANQRHSIHLMSRVLNIRHSSSPFTLLLDELNQRASPFVAEMVTRAVSRNINVVFVSFESLHSDPSIRDVRAAGKTGDEILSDLQFQMNDSKESLVIVDSLHDLLNDKKVDMGALFDLVSMKYASTLVGVYHQDLLPAQDAEASYAPQPLDLIKYLATTVITCKSLAHVLAAKAAKERSLAEPTFGLLQGAEGIVQSLDANDTRGIVLEAEFRRKSGRPESETFFLRPGDHYDYNTPMPGYAVGTLKREFVVLLAQVPAYASKEVIGRVQAAGNEIESTFELGLTEKQRQARGAVVLPYFDAQKGEGGEGGRILYDMGAEDDFDEEEDEI